MKKLTTLSILSIFFMIIIPAMAQEQTLISGDIESGGFGGPVLKATMFKDELGLMVGGRGGWIINHAFAIGGGGYGLATNIDAPESDYYLNVGYGGGIVECIILSDKLIHLSVNALIGGGGIGYREDNWDLDWDDDFDFAPTHRLWRRDVDSFFVTEPGVDLMLNLTRLCRVGVGVSYRYVYGVDFEGLSDEDMSGLSATFTFKFGKF